MKLQQIFEQSTDLSDPNADLPSYVPVDNEEQYEGAPRDKMSASDAKSYLDKYPFGVLNHEMYESDSFIFKTENGKYYFWNANHKDPNQSITPYDWVNDIKELEDDVAPGGEYEDEEINAFYYNPGYEFELRNGGIEFFREIRKLK